MVTPDPRTLPRARVVNGVAVPLCHDYQVRVADRVDQLAPKVRYVAAHVVGLWPVFAIFGLCTYFIWAAGMGAGP